MAKVITFDPKYAQQFRDLNLQWIKQYFVVEPMDVHELDHPESSIIAKGGQIFFCLDENGKVMGTCGVLPHDEHSFELIKMAVDPTSHGKGYGRMLMEAAMQWCKDKGIKKKKKKKKKKKGPAVNLYKKNGFEVIHTGTYPKYNRANIIFKRSLL
eukprot:Phypoly_transcript_23373.p1 GENE.Phypoly_transcript_23373~~Phypoly_transcript_23373.p1  ORF type:complete len:155 (+),score=34.46 Phypoly_transcript_23373:88-552(+)